MYFVAAMLVLKKLNAQTLLILTGYFFFYLLVHVFINRFLGTENNIPLHFKREFLFFSNFKRYIGIFLVLALPIVSQISPKYYYSFFFLELAILVFFFILITLLFISLIEFIILFWANPVSKGIILLCKTCAGAGVVYGTVLTCTAFFPIIPTSGLPLESALQTALLGFKLKTIADKTLFHKIVFAYPSLYENLEVTQDGYLDVVSAEKEYNTRQLKDIRAVGKAFATGVLDGVKEQTPPWPWMGPKK
jgi:hypothetical protein